MNESFNFRNPDPGEVVDLQMRAKQRIQARQKYKVLSQLISGKKDVDITVSTEIFEALNRERMEFEELMRLPQNQKNVNDCMLQAKEAREKHPDGKHWNPKSQAKWGELGHIPNCVYYSRPPEYWRDKKLLREFFNMFPKFRVSTKRL